MNITDKLLGVLLALIILFFIWFPGAHVSVLIMISIATITYGLFVVRTGKLRCKKCGHFFQLNVFEKYLSKTDTKKCGDCLMKPMDSDFTACNN